MGFMIYLIGVIDSLATIFMFVPIGLAIVGFVWFIWKLEETEDNWSIFYTYVKKSTVASLLCILVYAAIPNSKTVVAMYLIPKIVENKSVQKIPNKMLKIFDLKLDEWVKDLTPIKKKEK